MSTNAISQKNSQFTSVAAKTVTTPFFAAGFVLLVPTAAVYSLMGSKSESSTFSKFGMGDATTVFIASIPLAMAGFILALPAIPFGFWINRVNKIIAVELNFFTPLFCLYLIMLF